MAEHTRHQAFLDALEQRAKAFDHLFDAVVVTDLEGIVTDWNAGAEQLYGWSEREILGKPVTVLHVPEDSERIIHEVMDGIASEGRWHGEIKMVHKSGRIGHVESMVVPVADENGEMLGAIGVNRDISERIHAEERLQHMAFHDHLTGLANRALAVDRLGHAVEVARRKAAQVAVLFIDLDSFKTINDDFGHAAGDEVLRAVARRLTTTVRTSDTAARIGGDEFLVISDEVSSAEEAGEMASRIADALRVPHRVGEHERVVEASIGVAIFPLDASDPDTLLTQADNAMYSAKRGRRSRRG